MRVDVLRTHTSLVGQPPGRAGRVPFELPESVPRTVKLASKENTVRAKAILAFTI